jgi:periplasmic protein TonB
MFHDTLLDSSPSQHRQKRWPMATAFVLESVGAVVAIIIPLLSTGVIPLSNGFRCPVMLPIVKADVRAARASSGQNSAPRSSVPAVIAVNTNADVLRFGPSTHNSGNEPNPNPNFLASNGNGLDLRCDSCASSVKPGHEDKPFSVSHLSEAQLVHRVEPVYPRSAVLMNLQGEVQLHAIIAKDGAIQSLSVTSGHPLLAQAALDAVRQWRYRPYVLNGEPVEVETLITVNFRRGH